MGAADDDASPRAGRIDRRGGGRPHRRQPRRPAADPVEPRHLERPRPADARLPPRPAAASIHPFVPLSPQRHDLSIGVISYDGGLYFGFVGDRDRMPDLDTFAGFVDDELAALGRGRDNP